jgi:hypothetical protein
MTEEVRCTCLDRARIALEQTGQHHCAMVMGGLQKDFDALAKRFYMDSNQPELIIAHIVAEYNTLLQYHEAKR